MARETQEPQNPIDPTVAPDRLAIYTARADALRAEVEEEAEVFRAYLRAQTLCAVFTVAMLAASGLAFFYDLSNLGTALFILYLACTFAAILRIQWLTARGTHAVHKMTRHKHLDTIGVFVDLMENTVVPIQQLAGDVLTVLLPRLRATDAHLLNDRRRAILNRLLNPRSARTTQPLVLAILTAWEQVGDANAIAPVESLTWIRAYQVAPRKVRDAAAACLPALRNLAERDRLRNTLLRPVSDPGTPKETLLRPAAGSEAAPAVLLRSVDPGDVE